MLLLAAIRLSFAAEPLLPLQPSIQSIFPRGGQRGTEFEVSVEGKHLGGATELRFSGEGVSARILDSSESRIKARVTIRTGAAVGRRDLRVATPQGTFVQVFEVGALREQSEAEPNDDWSKAERVQLPVVVNGRTPAGDYDHFRFAAAAGQTLVFDFKSSRVGTRYDGVLALLDSHGREVASQDDYYFDKDPHLVYRFANAGEYILRVSGFREAGTKASEYRLAMGELPDLSWVFPAGGRRGETVEVSLAGANLKLAEGVTLDGVAAPAQIVEKSNDRLRARLSIPPAAQPGFYKLRVHASGVPVPNELNFVVSDQKEVLVRGPGSGEAIDWKAPAVFNGMIRNPKQTDNFRIDVQAGDQITLQADGMSLGNFLDPAVTIFDAEGNVEAYMDEAAPNGFDKEPPSLDFHLDHRFERAGRYRIEMRDAGFRGREGFVYRLSIGRSKPDFELVSLTNQLSVLAGHKAALPVRVRRLGGWNAPVKVWLDGLPSRVESHSMIAEPVNTRFRGTFGEDFFFDGTNVDVPVEAHQGAALGAYPLRLRASGTMNGVTLERSAVVFYPWQQTGYIRGKADDQDLLLTVAEAQAFELEGPATIQLTRGKPVKIPLRVRWLGEQRDPKAIQVTAGRMPAGVRLERFEAKPGTETISAWVISEAEGAGRGGVLSLVGLLRQGEHEYRRETPDIELVLTPKKEASAVAGN
ncbi:MAG TPA: PPC domain-containing protein [Bryobacteraceae bacterium]|nr:PPC domain-containing protein [Bryobacteraceae bacterium]